MDTYDAERFYSHMDNELKYRYADLVRGAIFGQAVGDALGHPIEFEKTREITDLDDINTFTDDTQMFCAIGEAMLDAPPHKDTEKFMEALSQRFIEWRQNPLGGSHRAPGGTCMEGVRKLGTGRHWRQTGATRDGKGNGGAMRAGIVGARYWREPATAFRIGCLTSINTHNNLESILAAGMVAFLVARSIQGCAFSDAVAEGLSLCADFENQVPDYPTNSVPLNNTRDGQSPWKAIASFSRGFILGSSNTAGEEFITGNGDDFTAVPAVSEAIFFNARNDEFCTMLIECANNSDDSDTITAITGTIAGARFGFDVLNEDSVTDDRQGSWTDRIEMRDYLEDLSKRIFEASLGAGELEETLAAQSIDSALGEEYVGGDEEEQFTAVGPNPLEQEEFVVLPDDDGEDFEVEF